MAEIVLTFALEETLKKVGLLAVEGIQLAWGFKAKLKKLSQSLESIRAVLRDAEDKQAEKPSVKDWLQRLREVAYVADDVLDEFGYEVLRQKVETTPTEKGLVNPLRDWKNNGFSFIPLKKWRPPAVGILKINVASYPPLGDNMEEIERRAEFTCL
ncbi:hypothetical protein Tsubulata_022886 [Turnera subulata]|uniref:Disease resistance N-terminal domain-containing protein n=1 Tax=Turnera subulata TaxID=218843 RepID=A0A9Q0J9S3_9ROSI|nr:hypothetical protein Tsubulata_022886 [Turnera subulata]